LLRFIPKSRMGIFAVSLLVLWVLKTLLLTAKVRESFPLLGIILNPLTLLLIIPAIYYLWKIFKYAKARVLWKIRRRLILAHIFIGATPILVVIGIFLSSYGLFYHQLSTFLISNQIGIHYAQIHAFNLSLREGMQQLMTGESRPAFAELKQLLDADAKYLLGAYPSASVILRCRDPKTNRIMTYANQNADPELLKGYKIPHWVEEKGDFRGLVVEDSNPAIPKTRLFLRSFISSTYRPDSPFSLEVSVPFDGYFLGRLRAAVGQNIQLEKANSMTGMVPPPPNEGMPEPVILFSTFESKNEQAYPFPIALFPISWNSGTDVNTGPADAFKADALKVELSISKLWQNLFRSDNAMGRLLYNILKILVIFFLLVEVAAIIIGIILTKSITAAVHNLDRGTEFVKRGDFSQRIIVRSQDQLGDLAASFNQMTETVQQLIKERVQSEKLAREIEIAKEVQEKLFPSRDPQIGRMDVTGICLPARTVGGDYYDFLPFGANELGLAIGDICGKGISAALLMANLQAALRSNAMNLWPHDRRNGEKIVAEVVEKLNAQIYNNTTSNKFASFFYALYDDTHQTLTYCNAGHNPPLFFDGNEVRRLSTGGTVVGIFADSKYEQETIHLKAGDVFLAYTDGITESLNEYGEEFGESRLLALIQENRDLSASQIKELVISSVLSWTYSEEREDDMTLVVARILKPS
jgi:sigma-B regulation protein RsbU (phosphoserine phosphatase)